MKLIPRAVVAATVALLSAPAVYANGFQFHVQTGPGTYSKTNTENQTITQTSNSSNGFQAAANVNFGSSSGSQTITQNQSITVKGKPK